MSAPILSPSLLPARAFARGKRLRGVRWIMMVWCLLFTVSVFSATHFPDGQAADDALEAIEAVVDDALSDTAQPAVFKTVSERALTGVTGKLPGQCADSPPWFSKASATPDAPSSNAVTSDPASDAPELWLPPPALPLAPVLRVARARPAFPPFRPGPAPVPMLRPPAHA